MNISNQIHEIELSIEDAQKHVELGKAIQRLENNPDYRAVFSTGYFRDEAARLTLLSADKNLTDKSREEVMVSIRSIGELHGYLRAKVGMASQMEAAIEEQAEYLDRLRQEEDAVEDDQAEGSDAE